MEIGKRDYLEDQKLGTRPFLKNLTFSLVDLGAMMLKRPDFLGRIFREVIAWVGQEGLRPHLDRVFPIAEVADAFKHLSRARHIGKVCVTLDDPAGTPSPPRAGTSGQTPAT